MKKILVILAVLLTTGCSVNYNLVIEDEELTETTTYTQEINNYYTKEYMNTLYKEEYPTYYDQEFLYLNPEEKIEGNTYYEKTLETNSNNYIATYKTKYDFDDFQRAQLLNLAYANFSIGYDSQEDCYYMFANDFKLFQTNEYLTDVTISIELKDYLVTESNHDKKIGTKYIWYLNKGNRNNINLKYKKIRDSENNNSSSSTQNNTIEENNNSNMLYIFCGILILLVIIGYLIYQKMKEKSENFDIDD